ncbi:hypothetical protein GM921_13945 [Pedobacter sp. LMG 31464]|uniref:SprT-like family protein n=1 Tax=Pedobacter planticolens TaxID=2679964 RepID=A0A923E1N0_9SPHI|nr:hypothetical protein [Pedobacter planticolens]MBB2146600.1 hypothetical protein [Pedobacter planticolens]
MKKLFNLSLKKINFLLIFGLSSLFLFINSCKKDIQYLTDELNKQEINKLSDWYHKNLVVADTNQFSRLKPMWKDVYVNEQTDYKVYEVALQNPEKLLVSTTNVSTENFEQQNNKHEIRLLLFEDKKNAALEFFCYIVLENQGNTEMENFHYKRPGEFSGKVLFYDPRGIMANGWTYNKGKLSHSITVTAKPEPTQVVKSGSKKLSNVYGSGTQCSSGFADRYMIVCGSYEGSTVTNCRLQFIGITYVTYCTEIRNEGDDGSGGGTEGPGGGGDYIPPVVIDCADVPNGDAYWNSSCNTCMGGTTGITECPLELKTDSLKKKFPCADKLIAQPILTSPIMSKFVEPFLTPQRPTVTYLTDNTLPWGNATTGGTFMLGNNAPVNSGAGLSSTVTFNEKMLQNSSQLLIAATVVHETLHAYINYKIAIAQYNYNAYNESNWMVGLNNFYLMGNLPANYSNHTMMLEDYFDKSMDVLQAWNAKQGFIYSTKDMASAMLYGLNTYDTGTSQTQINNINAVFQNVKTKYSITASDLTTFNLANLIATTNKLPTTGCNQ